MRVLMLGWEVPPHSAGGLGVACRDIANGLAREGVHVTFVAPRAPEDGEGGEGRAEPGGASVDWLGADRLPLRRRRVRWVPWEHAGDAAARESLELLAVDSPLRPYQRPDPAAADPAEVRARLERLRRGPTPAVRLELEETEEYEDPYGFTGGYGEDLFVEVERFARAVGEVARSRSFDVVHAHDWMTWPAALRAAERAGAPLVVHVHATELDRGGRRPDPRIRAVEELALQRADRVVCVSDGTADLVRRRYGVPAEKVLVARNGVPTSTPDLPGAAEAALAAGGPGGEDRPVVAYVGRLARQKGPGHFLAAAARVHAADPRVRFVVCGDGELMPEVVERAAALGLGRAVRFAGFLAPGDVRRVLAAADVFVLPSVSEPFGLAALEAARAGVPVIVSRRSGVAEVLSSCLKVDWWDAGEMASKILAVLRRPELRHHLVEVARQELAGLDWAPAVRSLRGVFAEVAPAAAGEATP